VVFFRNSITERKVMLIFYTFVLIYLQILKKLVILFSERMNEVDGLEPIPCQPWTSRLPKMAQPDLDFTGMHIR